MRDEERELGVRVGISQRETAFEGYGDDIYWALNYEQSISELVEMA